MARIPETELERLKREVSLERLAEARGVKLKRHGADLIGLCPFHEDHSPSLVISPKKNLWHCLGACRAGGSVIDWVMRSEGVSLCHAVELLRQEQLSFAVRPGEKPPQHSSVPKLPSPVRAGADGRALLLQVASYYHETLKQTPEALRYLESRGLKSSEVIDHFHLGFANRTLGYGLPQKNRQAGAERRGRLQRLGIFRESGHEHFNGSVVIPVVNLEGEVVEMYGRKITPGLRPGTPEHLYLAGPHRGVWNEEALIPSKEIILCEALIDALTFWCAAFRKHGTKKVYIAYDRDHAGEGAARALAEELMAQGIECFRVQFPKGMDANEFALKVTPAAKSLGVLLNKAAWLGKGKKAVASGEWPVASEQKPQGPHEDGEASTPATEKVTQGARGERIKGATKDEIEPAAKAKISEPIETTASEEKVLPLAAESPEPEQEAALPSVLLPAIEVPMEIKGDEITILQGDRRYRVRGLAKNLSRLTAGWRAAVPGRAVSPRSCLESASWRFERLAVLAHRLLALRHVTPCRLGYVNLRFPYGNFSICRKLQRQRLREACQRLSGVYIGERVERGALGPGPEKRCPHGPSHSFQNENHQTLHHR